MKLLPRLAVMLAMLPLIALLAIVAARTSTLQAELETEKKP